VIEIAEFVRVCGGALFLILLLYSFYASDFIFEVFGVSSALVMTVLSIVVVTAHSLIIPAPSQEELKVKINKACNTLGYGKKKWIDDPSESSVFKDVSSFLSKRWALLVKEVLSPFVFPFILLYLSSKGKTASIAGFLHNNSTNDPLTGWVLTGSLFSGDADTMISYSTDLENEGQILIPINSQPGDDSYFQETLKSSMVYFAFIFNKNEYRTSSDSYSNPDSKSEYFWDPRKNKFFVSSFETNYESPTMERSSGTSAISDIESEDGGSSTTRHVSKTRSYPSEYTQMSDPLDSLRKSKFESGPLLLSICGNGFEQTDEVKELVMKRLLESCSGFQAAQHQQSTGKDETTDGE